MENMINFAGLLSDEELEAIAGGEMCEDCTPACTTGITTSSIQTRAQEKSNRISG